MHPFSSHHDHHHHHHDCWTCYCFILHEHPMLLFSREEFSRYIQQVSLLCRTTLGSLSAHCLPIASLSKHKKNIFHLSSSLIKFCSSLKLFLKPVNIKKVYNFFYLNPLVFLHIIFFSENKITIMITHTSRCSKYHHDGQRVKKTHQKIIISVLWLSCPYF